MLSQNLKTKLRKLQNKKYREEFQEFIVEGVKGIKEAVSSGAVLKAVIFDEERKEEKDLHNLISLVKNANLHYCNVLELRGLYGTETFPGVMAIIAMKKEGIEDLLDDTPIILLDKINDPGNLGTIIRTADWFGLHNILLSEGSVDPYNEKTVRSSMGSIFRVKIVSSSNILSDLSEIKEKKYRVISLFMNGKNINELSPETKTVYLFGSESHGIDKELQDLSDEIYSIPGKGSAESLNIAIAAGIVMSKL